MTLPYERARSILYTRELLVDLLYGDDEDSKLSKEAEQRVKSALRHYPTEYDVRVLADRCPEILFMEDEIE